MFNDDTNVTQGLEESVYTDMPEESVTNYKNADSTDRRINQTILQVNKQKGEIDALVTTVNTDSGRIDSVEATLDSQSAKIQILSTNINLDNGDVQSVKTLRGYTFDSDGLKISSDENTFNSLSDNTGTYYKDGDTILTQFTKDKSIMRDMVLYGKYYYGVDENINVADFTKDDAMFIAEKFVDGNNEECFGHFYNGGD